MLADCVISYASFAFYYFAAAFFQLRCPLIADATLCCAAAAADIFTTSLFTPLI